MKHSTLVLALLHLLWFFPLFARHWFPKTIVMRVTSVSFLLSASVLKARKKSSGPYSLSVLAFLLSPLLCVPLVALASVGSGLPFSSCSPSFSFPFCFPVFLPFPVAPSLCFAFFPVLGPPSNQPLFFRCSFVYIGSGGSVTGGITAATFPSFYCRNGYWL